MKVNTKFIIKNIAKLWSKPLDLKDGDMIESEFYDTYHRRFYFSIKEDADMWIDDDDLDNGYIEIVED